MKKSGRGRQLAIFGVGVATALAGMAMFFAPSLYDVVDEGRDLRPYKSGYVYEIRVADTVTVYAAEESRPDPDVISGSAFVALATAALMAFLLLTAAGAPRRLRAFYALSAAGAAFLAADELVAIHETVGHNMAFLSDLPVIERPDDLIIALYLIPAAAFLFAFRDVLASSRRAVGFFAAGLAFFGAAALSDIAGVGADEPLEVLSAACIAGGFVALIATHLTGHLRRADEPKGEPPPGAATTTALTVN